ncbi:MAG: hypothetical protein MJZ81_07310 [Bacteroidales bacterium]|nr:hypothetical protein [Bacteroidales bacterium]
MARSDDGEGTSIFNVDWGLPYKNIDPFIGELIHNGRATLHELRTIYSLEDGYDILEADFVPAYNAFLRRKRAETKAEMRRLMMRR